MSVEIRVSLDTLQAEIAKLQSIAETACQEAQGAGARACEAERRLALTRLAVRRLITELRRYLLATPNQPEIRDNLREWFRNIR